MATIQDVKYDITFLDKELGKIKVKYKTDAFPRGLFYDLSLPIENNQTLKDKDLVDFIMFNAPIPQLTEAELVYAAIQARKAEASNVDFSHIEVVPFDVPKPEVKDNQPQTTGTTAL
jgi:hypothetical protein